MLQRRVTGGSEHYCTRVRYNGDIVPLDDNMLRRVKRVTDTLNRQGLRVVAKMRPNTCLRVRALPAYR